MALRAREARLRLMMDAVPAMITYLDMQERYLFCNKPYMDLLGITEEEILDRTMQEVLGEVLHERIAPWREQVKRGERAAYERQQVRPDGSVRDLSITFVPHMRDDGSVEGFFSLTLDITELKTLERKLAHMAQHDTLTGLPNRALYEDRLGQALERNKRHKACFALLFVDIDNFKPINDTRGHAAGDHLLRGFSARLRHCIRSADTVARLGGDEFAVILDGPISVADAEAIASKIVSEMRQPFEVEGHTAGLVVTASIGLAMTGDPDITARELEARADAALYEAKAKGRNTYAIR